MAYSTLGKGGRPPYDVVSMFKILILAARHNVSDVQMGYQIVDRLSWSRFIGIEVGEVSPDSNTIRMFRKRLPNAGALPSLFAELERLQSEAGYRATDGQIMDSTLIKAPKQKFIKVEKELLKAGLSKDEIWPDEPAKAAQKDIDACWTVVTGKKANKGGQQSGHKKQIAIPHFGYKNHISVDRKYGLMRRHKATHAASNDGHELPNLLGETNTGLNVWADTAYRSQKNE